MTGEEIEAESNANGQWLNQTDQTDVKAPS